MYQCKDTGEYFMYKFYELNSGRHYLVDTKGVVVSLTTDELNNDFTELDYVNGY